MTFDWLDKRIRLSDIIQVIGLIMAGIYMVFKLQGTVDRLDDTLKSLNSTVSELNRNLYEVRDRVLIIETKLDRDK